MNYKYSVAVVAIARLENPYINEWIQYHHNLGFAHFYIFDNSCGNEIHIDQAISDEHREYTTVIPAYNKKACQKQVYEDAYIMFNDQHDYMMYIDIDEFFTLNMPWDISRYIDFISRICPDFTDIRINWELYDDNDAIDRDRTIPVTQFFTHKADSNSAKMFNRQTKSIVRCGMNDISFPSVHYMLSSTETMKTCDAVGRTIQNSNSFVVESQDRSIAKIRHYMTKTISEYIDQKLNRGDAAGYIERDIDNRFFLFCKKTQDKIDYCKSVGIVVKSETKTIEDTLTYWYWVNSVPNVGDVYNRYLVQKLYACKTKKVNNGSPDVAFCGSILLMPLIKNTKHIVGAGLQHLTKGYTPPENPMYHAVRGQITKKLLDSVYGVKLDSDVVLCDPGILMSKLYQPKKQIQKKYKIGIVSHWSEENKVKELYGHEYRVISIQRDNPEKFVNDLLECEIILSSSLHGIIFSHSYGIPAYHIEFNDLTNNGNFKFNDYYSSFNNVNYCKFDCPDYQIPFDGILTYDNLQRKWSNPSIEQIKEKQEQFLKVLPYKEVLRDEFKV